ncbi:MAG: HAD family hydrolase, partial [Pseudomonadota bacterium]|nr:HAD family hydrolase [Pseudomonadota bacterium]
RHDLIPLQVLSAIRGVRIADSVRALAPRCSDIDAEIARLLSEERDKVDGIVLGAGARELLECLPRDIWPVVTSTNRGLAETRMHLVGLPKAPLLVAAEDVQAGKPAPDGYRIAAEKLGLDCEGTVVFENSDTGI